MKRPPDKPPQRRDRGRPRSVVDDSNLSRPAPPVGAGGRRRKASASVARPLRESKPMGPTAFAPDKVKAARRSCSDNFTSRKPDIGFGKPPKSHSWKPGQSGNPKGRKKGSRNQRTIIISLMEGRLGRKIPDPRKLTAQEGMLWKAIQKGLAGDAKAMAFAFKRYDDATANSWAGPGITTEEDRQVYHALREKIRREVEHDFKNVRRKELEMEIRAQISRELVEE